MRNNPGTIVVGIDGSEGSSRALQWAARQAAVEHRELTLVHTIGAVTPAYIDAAVVNVAKAQDSLHEAGHQVLEAARRDAGRGAPGVKVSHVLELADPRGLLVAMSETAAMVVVGSHGRGPVRSALLGSVGLELVRHARCPVVVIRPGNLGAVRNGVVVGVDALPESRPVLEFAYREASLRDLPLTVVHSGKDAESERLALSEAVAGMAEKYPEVAVTTRLSQGSPQEVLAELGERMDLVVVGAHQASGLDRVLHPSVSVAVVKHASCPVAVVPVRT
jgi:nucleotide-binding universal stress UspA family protein